MQVLAPDILALTRQLSPIVSLALLALGIALWLFGAKMHRFWLALVVTVAAGLVGLQTGREFGVQPLVAGLLLSLAAGALSLALARIAVFIAGGIAGIILARAVATGWNDFVCFLGGGLAGIALYPVWISVLTSMTGTVLMAYGLISFIDRVFRLNSPVWANRHAPLINWVLVGFVLLGMVLQYSIDRARKVAKEEKKSDEKEKKKEEKIEKAAPPPPEVKLPWWHWQRIVERINKAA